MKLFLISIFFSVLIFSDICGDSSIANAQTERPSDSTRSVQRVLPDDITRDKKMLRLTQNDPLTQKIIKQQSLVIGSTLSLKSHRDVYAWFVDHIKVSAALAQFLGKDYQISTGSTFEYHGVDGDDLIIDFNRSHSDSSSTIYVGNGIIKIFHIPVSGSFINYIEYNNSGNGSVTAQNCMYIMLNNSLNRFLANILMAVSDIEKGIMKKMFSLDEISIEMVSYFMNDPYLYYMLKHPEAEYPAAVSKKTVTFKEIIVRESSPETAKYLGLILEKARHEQGL